jgi:hypothetical protein
VVFLLRSRNPVYGLRLGSKVHLQISDSVFEFDKDWIPVFAPELGTPVASTLPTLLLPLDLLRPLPQLPCCCFH